MSRQGSAPSHGSRASNTKYKTVGHGGVDDALFGGSKTGGARNSTMSKDDLNTLLTKKPANVETDSIVITTGDLQRLRTLATVVDKSALEQQKHQEAAAKMALQAKARERKEKMVAMEVKRKANLVKSDLEAEDETKSANLLENSERARDEQLDDVKHMNQMMLYAKCVTIRDAQLLEKQMIQKEKADLEKSFDALMEQERVKVISMAEEQERKKVDERLRGASIIRMQIDQREKERLREQEQLDMEREAMLRQIDRLKHEEKAKDEERRVQGKKLLEEAALANKEQISRKDEARHKMAEEEQRIADYIADKDRREQERQEALDEENKRKAEETARLRALQEKAADKQAEVDALRAKRAQEDYEREHRKREQLEVDKKRSMLKDIMGSREDSKKMKERVQAEAAQQEKQQFVRILGVQKAAEDAESAKEDASLRRRIAHNEDIRRQITDNEELRQRNRQEFLEEGAKIRYGKTLEVKRLESIKQRKLAELQRAGVPEKYLAELQNKKMG